MNNKLEALEAYITNYIIDNYGSDYLIRTKADIEEIAEDFNNLYVIEGMPLPKELAAIDNCATNWYYLFDDIITDNDLPPEESLDWYDIE